MPNPTSSPPGLNRIHQRIGRSIPRHRAARSLGIAITCSTSPRRLRRTCRQLSTRMPSSGTREKAGKP